MNAGPCPACGKEWCTDINCLRPQMQARIDVLKDLLQRSRREHYHDVEHWVKCCPMCVHPSHAHVNNVSGNVCDCGAAEWNAGIDEAVK